MEKLGQVGEALDGKLPPLGTRRLLQADADRIEVDPDKCVGAIYPLANATALLESESIRRVRAASASVRNGGPADVHRISRPPKVTTETARFKGRSKTAAGGGAG